MAFTRIRTINGRYYHYLEERYREDGKVKSRSTYLGPASSGSIGGAFSIFKPIPPEEQGLRYIERLTEKYPGDPFAAKAAERQATKDTVSRELGVTFPKEGETVTPIEKTAPSPNPSAKDSQQTGQISAETSSPATPAGTAKSE